MMYQRNLRMATLCMLMAVLCTGCDWSKSALDAIFKKTERPREEEIQPLGPDDADFAFVDGHYYFKGVMLGRCSEVSEWIRALGKDYRSIVDGAPGNGLWITWNSVPGLGCGTTDDELHIRECFLSFRCWSNDEFCSRRSFYKKSVVIDGASIGPTTRPSELNRGKLGTKFRVGWYPELFETRTEDGKNLDHMVSASFNKRGQLEYLKISSYLCRSEGEASAR